MKERKQREISQSRAPSISRHEAVNRLESDARDGYFIKKTYVQLGKDAALEALRRSIEAGPDPSDSSMMASTSVNLVDSQLDSWLGSQDGRSVGGRRRGEQLAAEAAGDRDRILELATRLLNEGKKPRDIAGIIKTRRGYGRNKVYRALALHQSGYWAKKNPIR